MASQKLRGEGGSCRYMYWFEGGTQGKIGGGHAKFLRDNYPPPTKKWMKIITEDKVP